VKSLVTGPQPLAGRTYLERQTCVQTYVEITLVVFAPTSRDHGLTGGIGEAAAAQSAAKFVSVVWVEKSHLGVTDDDSDCVGLIDIELRHQKRRDILVRTGPIVPTANTFGGCAEWCRVNRCTGGLSASMGAT
jgi:hypothetical protein